MAKLNIQRLISETRGKVNSNYSLRVGDLIEIGSMNNNMFDSMSDAFILGYAQGMKAAKAEARKKGATV